VKTTEIIYSVSKSLVNAFNIFFHSLVHSLAYWPRYESLTIGLQVRMYMHYITKLMWTPAFS